MPRMHILTTAEHEAFDTPPVFSYAERETLFQSLPASTLFLRR
jgi:hypothetical protein